MKWKTKKPRERDIDFLDTLEELRQEVGVN